MSKVEEVAEQQPPTGESPREQKKSSFFGYIAELPILVLFAFGIAVLIKTFLVQAFFIPSGSMLPTLQIGDRVLVEKVSYVLGDPGPGDVVVFARSVFGVEQELPWEQDARNFVRELLGLPSGSEEDYIKRIVAVGGNTIRYAGSPRRLTVDGEKVEEPYLETRDTGSPTVTARDCKRLRMTRQGSTCLVPEGRVFVMGDNRGNSEDSRVIGTISQDKIVGHAFAVIWPPVDFSGL